MNLIMIIDDNIFKGGAAQSKKSMAVGRDSSLFCSWTWIVFWFEEVAMGGRTSLFNWIPWTRRIETNTTDS